MARGYNSVLFVGTLTQKPELRYTPGGLAILDMSIAGSDHVMGNDGQMRDLAWYHRVSLLGKSAEIIADQLEQGTAVFVDGRLDFRSWTDGGGQKRSALDIKAIRVDVLSYGTRQGEAVATDVKGQPRLHNALNQVTLIGNLTRDVELRYTQGGDAVARLSVAVNENYRDRSGVDQERVHFVDISVWRDVAEACASLRRGDPVFVMGRFKTDNWTDRDGNRQFKNQVEGVRVEFLTRGPGGGGTSTRLAAANDHAAGAQASQQPSSGNLDIDEEFPPEEDLPF